MNWYLLICTAVAVNTIPIDDPSEWPGHLDPFGSKQKTQDITDVLYHWPSPQDFFRNYVDESKPVLIRGVYKQSKPVTLWTDEYMLINPDVKTATVSEEPSLIENRTASHRTVTFYEFLNTYHKKPILTYSTIPKYLMRDVYLPPSLKCNETTKYFVNAMLLMSQGGSKSTVYNDDEESIHCTFRGAVDYLLVEYKKNKHFVIDRPEGGYASFNVEKVDYVKYPKLRNIDLYLKASLQPGDCLYVPYRWYKQYNGLANEAGQSISMNFWFKHLHDHSPTSCTTPHDQTTLDRYEFSDLVEEYEDRVMSRVNGTENADNDNVSDDTNNDDKTQSQITDYGGHNLLMHFYTVVERRKKKNTTLPYFYHIIKKDEYLTRQSHKGLTFPKSFQLLAVELFEKLDTNRNKMLTEEDFHLLAEHDEKRLVMERYLAFQCARIEDYVEDLIEAKHHGKETMHEFDKRKMEEIKAARPFDEL